ncbi:heavy-metal-associated domain-containing protein [Azospirillum sp. sgz302134]
MADTYKVDGMTCGGCARSVTNAITKVAPDAKVAVDLTAGTVSVDGGVPADTVKKAVEGAGFDFGGQAA